MEFGDPEEIAQFERTDKGFGTLFREFFADIVAVVSSADFTVV